MISKSWILHDLHACTFYNKEVPATEQNRKFYSAEIPTFN